MTSKTTTEKLYSLKELLDHIPASKLEALIGVLRSRDGNSTTDVFDEAMALAEDLPFSLTDTIVRIDVSGVPAFEGLATLTYSKANTWNTLGGWEATLRPGLYVPLKFLEGVTFTSSYSKRKYEENRRYQSDNTWNCRNCRVAKSEFLSAFVTLIERGKIHPNEHACTKWYGTVLNSQEPNSWISFTQDEAMSSVVANKRISNWSVQYDFDEMLTWEFHYRMTPYLREEVTARCNYLKKQMKLDPEAKQAAILQRSVEKTVDVLEAIEMINRLRTVIDSVSLGLEKDTLSASTIEAFRKEIIAARGDVSHHAKALTKHFAKKRPKFLEE